MKPIILVIYLISTGMSVEPYANVEDCEDALLEASIVKGRDLWTGGCFDRADWKPGMKVTMEMFKQ